MKRLGFSATVCLLLLLLCFAVPSGQIKWEASDALYTGADMPRISGILLPYGTGLAISATTAWLIAFILCHRRISLQDSLRWFMYALVLGIFFSRLLYCMVEFAYYNPEWVSRHAAGRIWDGGMAMSGALLGILLATRIVPKGAGLTAFATPLFLVGARLSEMFTQVGYGASIESGGVFSRQIGYAVRFNVSILEAMTALIIFGCIAFIQYRAFRRGIDLSDSERVSVFFILYGISQVFMESLRKDRHMIWGFVKVQQIFAIIFVLGTLIVLARSGRERIKALLITSCTVIPLVCLEFALDRADVSVWLLYAIYLIILSVYMKAALNVFAQFVLFEKE